MMQAVSRREVNRVGVDSKTHALGVRGAPWLAGLLLLAAQLVSPSRVLGDSTGEHAPTAATGAFTNASNAFACGGSTATATGNSQAEQYSVYGLSLPNTVPTPVVTGIQVRVRANDGTKNNRKLLVSLSWDGGTTFTSGTGIGVLQTRNFRRNAQLKDYTLGGSAVLWGRTSWSASELSDANFRVKVSAKMPGGSGDNINLDCIPVTVFYQVPGLPDLSVAKTASPDPVGPTGTLTYTITYSNTGQSTATNVILSDVTPTNTTFVSASPAPTSAPPPGSTGTVIWNVGSVPVGGSGVVTLVVKVNASINTTIDNTTYSIASDQNAATFGNAVSTTVANAVLTLSKSASPDPVAPGGTLTYTLTLHNAGSVTAQSVVVNESYDGNAPFSSQSTSPTGCASFVPSLDQWTITSFVAGATCTITITTTVVSPLEDGVVLVNLADASDDAGDATSAGAVSIVQQCAGQADGSSCNDHNVCTQTDTCQNQLCVGRNPQVCTPLDQCHVAGTCNPTTGCSNPQAPDTTPCDDGNACTTGDACSGGTCAGTPYSCAAPDQCHLAGTCNGDGTCSYAQQPDGTGCNDGNACTTADACSGGTCVGGPAPDCNDGNACTTDSCNTSLGCQHDIQPNCISCNTDSACDNHNACDGVETCVLGKCQSGTPPTCNDLNPCTDDSCDPASGCKYTNNTAPCDDHNACTQTDTCQNGACSGGNPVLCTALDQCHDVGTCDTGTGICSNPAKADNTACNDGNACTQTDTCQNGACTGGNPVICTALDQCHDVGTCDTGTGTCSNPAKADNAACNDGNACTQADTCFSGICVGNNPVACTQLDQCHVVGTCDAGTGVCSNPTAADNTACNDGDACTQADICLSGFCTGTNPVVCTASDQCHVAGTCDMGTGVCSNPQLQDGTTCSDGDACTQTDICLAGVCTGGNPVICTALDQCHDVGTCNPVSGACSNPALQDNTSCTDNNACTVGDVCIAGTCTPGSPLSCDDGNLCTDDSCVAASGCVHVNNNASCNDNNACTTADACSGGHCAGTPYSCAPPDQCHQTGTCNGDGTCSYANQPDGTGCSDGNACTLGDTCKAGACAPGTLDTCNDNNACSTDSCDPQRGCQHVFQQNCQACNTDAQCDNNNKCDGIETCVAGKCQSGTPPNCDDGNVCTNDGCDPGSGCTHTANSAPCDDGNGCTIGDFCSNKVCQPGTTQKDCNDHNVCTDDTCSAPSGACVHTANTAQCSDGDDCTQTDTCQNKVCVGSNQVACNPLDQCHVAGTCDTGTGLCSNPAIADNTACNDHDAATCRDVCTNGTCGGSTDPVACVDYFKCYAAHTKQGTLRFKQHTVTLDDEFENKSTIVARPVQICNPAGENGGATMDPTTHLECYAIRDASTKPRQLRFQARNLETTNVLKPHGGNKLRAMRPQMVCVPAEQDNQTSSLDIDHFKCYATAIQRGTSRFTSLNVPVVDEFETKLTTVARPVQICNPANENSSTITKPTAHLECFAIRDASTKPRQSRFTKRDVTTQDDFGSETLTVTRPTTLCVPSLTSPMP